MSDRITSQRIVRHRTFGEMDMLIGGEVVFYSFAESPYELQALLKQGPALVDPRIGSILVDRKVKRAVCGPISDPLKYELSTDEVFEGDDINHLLLARRAMEALGHV